MEAVFGLLLMLLGVSQGVELHCDGRQEGAQCYGALGGTVVLRLMDNTSEIRWFRWANKAGTILSWRNNSIVFNQIKHRSVFTRSDGTFRINNLNRRDSGKYTLDIFDSNGVRPAQRTLQLTIQAPVSSVLLVSECLSQGEMRVSCSSEGGDSPQYSWTLDGHTLTDTQLLSGSNETNNITLKPDVSGKLVCSVSNHISRISTCGFAFIDCNTPNAMHISLRVKASTNTLCIEPTTISTTIKDTVDRSLLICGVRTAVFILIIVGIAVYFAWKKKKYMKAEASVDHRWVEYENVQVVEVRSSASEL